MRIFDVRFTARRVAAFVAMLLVVVAADVVSVILIPPSYSASGAVVLIGPSTTGTPTGGTTTTNPFLNFSESLGVTADVLSIQATDDASLRAIVDQGGSSDYSVSRTGAPIMTVSATARTAELSIKTTSLIVSRMYTLLASIQSAQQIPAASSATLVWLSQSNTASRQWKTPAEVGATVGVVGIALAVLIMVVFDRRQTRKQGRQSLEDVVANASGAPPETDEPSLAASVASAQPARVLVQTDSAPDPDDGSQVTVIERSEDVEEPVAATEPTAVDEPVADEPEVVAQAADDEASDVDEPVADEPEVVAEAADDEASDVEAPQDDQTAAPATAAATGVVSKRRLRRQRAAAARLAARAGTAPDDTVQADGVGETGESAAAAELAAEDATDDAHEAPVTDDDGHGADEVADADAPATEPAGRR